MTDVAAPSDVMQAYAWPTNGHLIEDVARLGYIARSDLTLDMTFGRGVWWQRWAPDQLVTVAHASDPDHAPADFECDFRSLPMADDSFDVVAFDPPYVLKGTAAQFSAMNQRFGLFDQRLGREITRKDALTELIVDGLIEAARLARPGGLILAKGGRGTDGAKLFRTDDLMVAHAERPRRVSLAPAMRPADVLSLAQHPRAEEIARVWLAVHDMHAAPCGLGLEVVTQFRMLTKPRSQKHRGPQQSARSNYSTLTIFRVPS